MIQCQWVSRRLFVACLITVFVLVCAVRAYMLDCVLGCFLLRRCLLWRRMWWSEARSSCRSTALWSAAVSAEWWDRWVVAFF